MDRIPRLSNLDLAGNLAVETLVQRFQTGIKAI
jgi:hypothetical protein